MDKETIILKIGGSLITEKHVDEPKINNDAMARICKEIGEAYNQLKDKKNLFIVHGAGSYGHVIAKKTGIDNGIKNEKNLVDFAETQKLQNELNCKVVEELIANGIPAFPFQCSSHAVMKNKKLEMMFSGAAEGLVSIGMVPVAFGVPAYDMTQKCSILSGDTIVPFFALSLGAKKIIHATDVDGVFTADPNVDKSAVLLKEIDSSNFEEIKKNLSSSSATDVTGGMLNKVSELVDLGQLGVVSLIVNGLKEGVIKKALLGENTEGTVIKI